MPKTIVTISGLPRSGKDTFARALIHHLGAAGVNAMAISSISSAKGLLYSAASEIGQPIPSGEELTSEQRQALAKIKEGLDIAMDYTVELPFRAFGLYNVEVVVYQVREEQNLQQLRGECTAEVRGMGKADVELVAVHVRNSYSSAGDAMVRYAEASQAERDLEQSKFVFDVAVNNTTLDALDNWAELTAKLILGGKPA